MTLYDKRHLTVAGWGKVQARDDVLQRIGNPAYATGINSSQKSGTLSKIRGYHGENVMDFTTMYT